MQYNQMKFAVGLFVVIFLLLFTLFIAVILEKKGVFEEKLTFNFYTQSADSFHIGMALRFSGFEIGSISDIALTEEGRVHVMFEVKKSNHKWICEDTLLMLDKPLIGSPTIDVLSSLGYPPLTSGSTLSIIVRDDINDIVTNFEPLVEELQSIVTSVNTITTRLSAEESDLFITLQNLRRFSESLSDNKALLTTITGDEASTELFKSTLNETASVMKQVNTLSKRLNDMIDELRIDLVHPTGNAIELLEQILRDVKTKLDTLDGTVTAVGSYDTDLLEFKDNIRLGLEKTNLLIDKIDRILEGQGSGKMELP